MRKQWEVISAGVFVMFCAGTLYGFGVWSDELKQRMHLTEPQIQNVVIAGGFSMYLSLVNGFVYDSFGPRPVATVGIVFLGLGYALLYLSTVHVVPGTAATAALFTFIWAYGSSWLDTAAVLTVVKCFPAHRGLVVGLLKSSYGLSAGIFVQVYNTFFADDIAGYLLLLAISLPAVSALFAGFLRLPPLMGGMSSTLLPPTPPSYAPAGGAADAAAAAPSRELLLPAGEEGGASASAAASLLQPHTAGAHGGYGTTQGHPAAAADGSSGGPGVVARILVVNVMVLVLALVCGASSVLHSQQLLPAAANMAVTCFVGLALLLLAFYPLWHRRPAVLIERLMRSGRAVADHAGAVGGSEGADPAAADLDDLEALSPRTLVKTADEDVRQLGEQGLTLPQALCNLHFWMLLLAMTLSMGSGVTVISNIAQIHASMLPAPAHPLNDTAAAHVHPAPLLGAGGGGGHSAAVFVSVQSVGNCLGRMGMGFMSDALLHRVPRTAWVALSALAQACVHAIMLPMSPGLLYAACALNGLAYGAMWSLLPAIVSELFGLRHFGALYTFQAIAPSLGSLGYAQLVNVVYEAHEQAGEHDCYGPGCFAETFAIMGGAALLAALLAAGLTWRTRGQYRAISRENALLTAAEKAEAKADGARAGAE